MEPLCCNLYIQVNRKKKNTSSSFDKKIGSNIQDTVNKQSVLERWHSQILFPFSNPRVGHSLETDNSIILLLGSMTYLIPKILGND